MVPIDEPRVCRPSDEDGRGEFYSGSGSGRKLPYPSLLFGWRRIRVSHSVVLPAGGALGTIRQDSMSFERPIDGGLTRGGRSSLQEVAQNGGDSSRSRKTERSDKVDDLVEIPGYFYFFTTTKNASWNL